MDQPEAGSVQTVIRRRPTRRHRRNRLIRRAVLGLLFVSLGFGGASIALQYLSPSLFRASAPVPQNRGGGSAVKALLLAQQEAARSVESRPVYPYSVVPGGVSDARELQRAAQRDPVDDPDSGSQRPPPSRPSFVRSSHDLHMVSTWSPHGLHPAGTQ